MNIAKPLTQLTKDKQIAVVSWRWSCLPVPEEVTAHGTHAKIPAIGWEADHRHRCKQYGDWKCALTNAQGPRTCISLLQQNPIQGLEELLCDKMGVTGHCENVGTFPQIPLWTGFYLHTDHSTLTWFLNFRTWKDRWPHWVNPKSTILQPNLISGTSPMRCVL
jgi:hypothetical protein